MDRVERVGRRGGVGRRRGSDGQHQSAQEARRGVRGAVSGRAGPPPEEGAEVSAEVNEVERMSGTTVPAFRDTTDPVDPVDAIEPVDPIDPMAPTEESAGASAPDPRLPGARSGSRRQGGAADSRDRAAARELFVSLRSLPDGSPERAELRDRLVRMHLPLVEHLARRFRNRGEPLDDLTQVATIGLIKSVDRFDPERGVEFSTYATPTVVGEIKRHFRDKGWAVRVPRRLQELRLSLSAATAELSQQHGRAPTVHELAERLNTSEEEVLEGLESANAYSTLSLDVPDTDDESPAVADTLGAEDDALEGVEYRESLKPLLEELPPREKKILMLRFFGNMTQSQIAQEVGISQMHVSRLLARTLAQLREKLLVEE
ncbi:SigB/SigF/SigG family RNA polymerase sigma factor [Streptomyces sp. IF17]|nr:SigB/SigF/SigG family RNA polymerase sigma factor [Streptomyces alkaliphilus]